MSDTPRFDLLLVPADGGHILPDAAARSLLRQLALHQMAIPYDEAVARTWVEVYLKPGEAAHLVFAEGAAVGSPGDPPPFVEGVFRFSEARHPLPFGDGPPVAVSLELWGTAHEDMLGAFKQRVADVWQMRVTHHSRPHAGVPAHRVVGEDERPIVPEKKQAPLGAVGVRVEEF